MLHVKNVFKGYIQSIVNKIARLKINPDRDIPMQTTILTG